ncbi:tetratricopeptide repeat protein [Patescibacteria group bacterium]|nr:tetratricopeptide repeat protein [Patescibacteria group bacterium]MBU1123171.1 tetratricopeptide repeat protein [Patescibacteria group bacterium]MBU1911426.1 tetratricopeptide repeat protein [Patescibacteria group bacterium]
MKIPARIIIPVALAAFLAGLLAAFLWWQISQSTAILEDPLSFLRPDAQAPTSTYIPEAPIDPRDKALVYLREGDLLSVRGEWKDAQDSYSKAVSEGGGLPALRKLAQAQLQRRDIKGLRSTISKMQSAGARQEDLTLLESIVELRAGELIKANSILIDAPDSPQKHYGLALLALVQGNHDIAQLELAQVINGWEPVLRSYARTLAAAYDEYALFPEGSNLHLITLLARALAQVQECELALPLLVQVTNTMNDYRDAWIVQGYCELVTERFEDSLASLEQAYNIDPQKPETQYFLARSYAALQQHQNAITFFEYSLVNGFEPAVEIRRLIAEEALESGNTTLALKQYEALTQEENAPFETFEGYITASLALGNFEEAYLKAKEVTQRWPQNAHAFELLGWASMETDRKEEARDAFQQALSINPELKGVQEKLIDLTE